MEKKYWIADFVEERIIYSIQKTFPDTWEKELGSLKAAIEIIKELSKTATYEINGEIPANLISRQEIRTIPDSNSPTGTREVNVNMIINLPVKTLLNNLLTIIQTKLNNEKPSISDDADVLPNAGNFLFESTEGIEHKANQTN